MTNLMLVTLAYALFLSPQGGGSRTGTAHLHIRELEFGASQHPTHPRFPQRRSDIDVAGAGLAEAALAPTERAEAKSVAKSKAIQRFNFVGVS